MQVINSRFLATKTDKNNALANMFMHQVQNLIENNGGEKYIFMEYYDVVPPMEVSGNLDGSLETTPEQQQEQGLDPVERLKLLYPNWGKSPLEICWQQDSQQQNDATSSSELLEQSFDEENGQEEEEEVSCKYILLLSERHLGCGVVIFTGGFNSKFVPYWEDLSKARFISESSYAGSKGKIHTVVSFIVGPISALSTFSCTYESDPGSTPQKKFSRNVTKFAHNSLF